uniref:Uncharacterized protein n=1 Tax=Rhabditophanes sp. KR3021 TaxID=114890 RepID=A0AC35THT6_9BILA
MILPLSQGNRPLLEATIGYWITVAKNELITSTLIKFILEDMPVGTELMSPPILVAMTTKLSLRHVNTLMDWLSAKSE